MFKNFKKALITACSVMTVSASLITMAAVANAESDNSGNTETLITKGVGVPKLAGNPDDLPSVQPGNMDNPPRNQWFNMADTNISYYVGDNRVGKNANWYDANKWYREKERPNGNGGHDKNACWKASSANQLEWWLHSNADFVKAYFDKYPEERKTLLGDTPVLHDVDSNKYNPILDFYDEMFEDKSGYQTGGNKWFITGEKTDQLAAPFKSSADQFFKGFFSKVFNQQDGMDNITDYRKFAGGHENALKYFSDFVHDALRDGKSVGFEIYFPEDHYRHAVTMWGAEFKNGLVQYLYYSDSDEQNDYAEKMNRIQRVKVLPSDDGTLLYMTSDRKATKIDRRLPQITSVSSLSLGTDAWEKWFHENFKPVPPMIAPDPPMIAPDRPKPTPVASVGKVTVKYLNCSLGDAPRLRCADKVGEEVFNEFSSDKEFISKDSLKNIPVGYKILKATAFPYIEGYDDTYTDDFGKTFKRKDSTIIVPVTPAVYSVVVHYNAGNNEVGTQTLYGVKANASIERNTLKIPEGYELSPEVYSDIKTSSNDAVDKDGLGVVNVNVPVIKVPQLNIIVHYKNNGVEVGNQDIPNAIPVHKSVLHAPEGYSIDKSVPDRIDVNGINLDVNVVRNPIDVTIHFVQNGNSIPNVEDVHTKGVFKGDKLDVGSFEIPKGYKLKGNKWDVSISVGSAGETCTGATCEKTPRKSDKYTLTGVETSDIHDGVLNVNVGTYVRDVTVNYCNTEFLSNPYIRCGDSVKTEVLHNVSSTVSSIDKSELHAPVGYKVMDNPVYYYFEGSTERYSDDLSQHFKFQGDRVSIPVIPYVYNVRVHYMDDGEEFGQQLFTDVKANASIEKSALKVPKDYVLDKSVPDSIPTSLENVLAKHTNELNVNVEVNRATHDVTVHYKRNGIEVGSQTLEGVKTGEPVSKSSLNAPDGYVLDDSTPDTIEAADDDVDVIVKKVTPWAEIISATPVARDVSVYYVESLIGQLTLEKLEDNPFVYADRSPDHIKITGDKAPITQFKAPDAYFITKDYDAWWKKNGLMDDNGNLIASAKGNIYVPIKRIEYGMDLRNLIAEGDKTIYEVRMIPTHESVDDVAKDRLNKIDSKNEPFYSLGRLGFNPDSSHGSDGCGIVKPGQTGDHQYFEQTACYDIIKLQRVPKSKGVPIDSDKVGLPLASDLGHPAFKSMFSRVLHDMFKGQEVPYVKPVESNDCSQSKSCAQFNIDNHEPITNLKLNKNQKLVFIRDVFNDEDQRGMVRFLLFELDDGSRNVTVNYKYDGKVVGSQVVENVKIDEPISGSVLKVPDGYALNDIPDGLKVDGDSVDVNVLKITPWAEINTDIVKQYHDVTVHYKSNGVEVGSEVVKHVVVGDKISKRSLHVPNGYALKYGTPDTIDASGDNVEVMVDGINDHKVDKPLTREMAHMDIDRNGVDWKVGEPLTREMASMKTDKDIVKWKKGDPLTREMARMSMDKDIVKWQVGGELSHQSEVKREPDKSVKDVAKKPAEKPEVKPVVEKPAVYSLASTGANVALLVVAMVATGLLGVYFKKQGKHLA